MYVSTQKGLCGERLLIRLPGTEYMQAIIAFVFLIIAIFTLPETYGPVLLKRKARRLRNETGKPYWHPHEKERLSFNNIVTKHLSRPLRYFASAPHRPRLSLRVGLLTS